MTVSGNVTIYLCFSEHGCTNCTTNKLVMNFGKATCAISSIGFSYSILIHVYTFNISFSYSTPNVMTQYQKYSSFGNGIPK